MIQRYLAIIAVVFFSSLAQAIPVADVPNPFENPGSFVVDQGQVLSPDDRGLITTTSQQLYNKTGVELVVITVDNLDGLTIDDYAEQLFKRLGVGEKGKDNGVLILLARDDRRIRIEVGYGLESVLNDAKAGRLLDDHAVPFLKKNEFGRGLIDGAAAVALALNAVTPESMASTHVQDKTGEVFAAMMMFTITLTIIAILAKIFMVWRRKTRDGRKAAISAFDNTTVTMVILAPLATAMVGYSEGILWTGILVAFIPLVWGLLVYWGFRRWAQIVSKWTPQCVTCNGPMAYQSTVTAELAGEADKKLRIAEQRELWTCAKCGAEKILVDKVYMGTRSSSGWSYSRPSSGGGRSGGGSSGGGGASRGF